MKMWSTQFNRSLEPHFRRARSLCEVPDREAVKELCSRLTGLMSHKFMEVADAVMDLRMPRGYLHVRIVDEADGLEIASCFSHDDVPVTPEEITMLVTLNDRFLAGQWVSTSALPDRDPGVLDLAVRFEKRPRPLDFFDVD